jgi:Uma2 family endonuclease
VTCSQGGFKLETGEIVAKEIYRNLDSWQRTTFQGPPFSPVFVVEVDDNLGDTTSSKFKLKNTYFTASTSVRLGWLIDPQKHIWVYSDTRPYSTVYYAPKLFLT